jgi:hypothetical protein
MPSEWDSTPSEGEDRRLARALDTWRIAPADASLARRIVAAAAVRARPVRQPSWLDVWTPSGWLPRLVGLSAAAALGIALGLFDQSTETSAAALDLWGDNLLEDSMLDLGNGGDS